jgi:hypothetical protein
MGGAVDRRMAAQAPFAPGTEAGRDLGPERGAGDEQPRVGLTLPRGGGRERVALRLRARHQRIELGAAEAAPPIGFQRCGLH